MGTYRSDRRGVDIKYFLLIESFGENNKQFDNDQICRYLAFTDETPGFQDLMKFYSDCIYELTEKQYQRAKAYQKYKTGNKKDFFIESDLEELLI
jgi:hypothetical protein